MSFFRWFKRTTAPASHPPGSASARARAEAATRRTPAISAEMAQEHRAERMERREQLYAVVRDALVRAGVLSASYKFKVLALDPRSQQFLVMMDLAREYGGETVRLNDIEGLIAQTAKTRHGIGVRAVYWRIDDHIVAAMAHKGLVSQRQGLPPSLTVPVPAHAAAESAGAESPPLRPGAAAAGLARTRSIDSAVLPSDPADRLVAPRFDPIEADEVAAFKRVLANAAAARTPGASAPSYAAVHTGSRRRKNPGDSEFPDTVLPDPSEQRMRSPDLSTTQYGDL